MKIATGLIVMVLAIVAGCSSHRPGVADESLGAPVMFPRLAHFDISLPYPVWTPAWAADSTEDAFQLERYIPVVLQIDTAGQVTATAFADPADSLYEELYSIYLKTLRFEPGLKLGRPASMALPVLLQVRAVCSAPRVRFPVEENRGVFLTDLYWEAFRVNGIEVPRLIKYPSYYYEFQTDHDGRRYSSIVYQVDLDSTGDVTSVRQLPSSDPFADQIRLGLHWATYTPLRHNGVARASSNFLVVSPLPGVRYPTPAIDYSSDSDLSDWDRARVRLVPDTIGLLNPPVPKTDWSGAIPTRRSMPREEGLVSGRIAVDSAGLSIVSHISDQTGQSRGLLNVRSFENRFYPAIDFRGRPYPFDGLVYLAYLSESNIRVWFSWFSTPDSGGIR